MNLMSAHLILNHLILNLLFIAIYRTEQDDYDYHLNYFLQFKDLPFLVHLIQKLHERARLLNSKVQEVKSHQYWE
jgi:hypothetical protein